MTLLDDRPAIVTAPVSVMEVVPRRGGPLITWKPESEQEVAAAQLVFDEKVRQGFLASAETRSGGVQIREFDPTAERIVMVAPLAGG